MHRRYSDFVWLRDMLVHEQRGQIIPVRHLSAHYDILEFLHEQCTGIRVLAGEMVLTAGRVIIAMSGIEPLLSDLA